MRADGMDHAQRRFRPGHSTIVCSPAR
jgi:hypothetical protein